VVEHLAFFVLNELELSSQIKKMVPFLRNESTVVSKSVSYSRSVEGSSSSFSTVLCISVFVALRWSFSFVCFYSLCSATVLLSIPFTRFTKAVLSLL
jgi:hypothetical protein